MDEDGDYDSGEEDPHHAKATCQRLGEVLSEKYGEDTSKEIRQIFCDVKEQMQSERPKRTKSQHSHGTNRS